MEGVRAERSHKSGVVIRVVLELARDDSCRHIRLSDGGVSCAVEFATGGTARADNLERVISGMQQHLSPGALMQKKDPDRPRWTTWESLISQQFWRESFVYDKACNLQSGWTRWIQTCPTDPPLETTARLASTEEVMAAMSDFMGDEGDEGDDSTVLEAMAEFRRQMRGQPRDICDAFALRLRALTRTIPTQPTGTCTTFCGGTGTATSGTGYMSYEEHCGAPDKEATNAPSPVVYAKPVMDSNLAICNPDHNSIDPSDPPNAMTTEQVADILVDQANVRIDGEPREACRDLPFEDVNLAICNPDHNSRGMMKISALTIGLGGVFTLLLLTFLIPDIDPSDPPNAMTAEQVADILVDQANVRIDGEPREARRDLPFEDVNLAICNPDHNSRGMMKISALTIGLGGVFTLLLLTFLIPDIDPSDPPNAMTAEQVADIDPSDPPNAMTAEQVADILVDQAIARIDGEPREARRDLQRALDLDPSYDLAQEYLDTMATQRR
eukprot:COSAG02_NODE_1858_length_10636_cov_6.878333_3_plen_498_part_00